MSDPVVSPEAPAALDRSGIRTIALEGFTFYLTFADLLPPLDPDEFAALEADITQNGIKVPLTICLIRDRHYDVLDGQHRLLIAERLGLKRAAIPFTTEPSNLVDEQREQIAVNLNRNRRQLTREKLQAWALKLRQAGKSYRWIADYLDASPATVYRAVQSGVSNETPEPGAPTAADQPPAPQPSTITGRDGKLYPAAFQPTPITEMDLENVLGIIRDEGPIHRNILERRVMERFTLGSRVLAATLQRLLDEKKIDRDKDLRYTLPELPATTRTGTDADKIYEYLVEQGKPVWLKSLAMLLMIDADHVTRSINLLEAEGKVVRSTSANNMPLVAAVVKPALQAESEPEVAPDDEPVSPSPESEPAISDELRATFDKDQITLLNNIDNGAWHRAIEIARKLVAAGVWDGQARIEFDAYALHHRLFGPSACAPSELIAGVHYALVETPVAAESPTADPTPAESEGDDAPPIRGLGVPTVETMREMIIDTLAKSQRGLGWSELYKYVRKEFGRDDTPALLRTYNEAARAMKDAGSITSYYHPNVGLRFHFPHIVEKLKASLGIDEKPAADEGDHADGTDKLPAAAQLPADLDALEVALTMVMRAMNSTLAVAAPNWEQITPARREHARALLNETLSTAGALMVYLDETLRPTMEAAPSEESAPASAGA